MLAKLINIYPRSPSEPAFPHMPISIFLFKEVPGEGLHERHGPVFPGNVALYWIICSVDNQGLDKPVENLTLFVYMALEARC